MTITLRCAPVAITFALCLGIAAPAKAADCVPLTQLQQRIVDKSEQGVVALRRFVERTRMIHQLSMYDIAESLDAWRAVSTCAKRVALATSE